MLGQPSKPAATDIDVMRRSADIAAKPTDLQDNSYQRKFDKPKFALRQRYTGSVHNEDGVKAQHNKSSFVSRRRNDVVVTDRASCCDPTANGASLCRKQAQPANSQYSSIQNEQSIARPRRCLTKARLDKSHNADKLVELGPFK